MRSPSGLTFGALFAYISGSSFVLQRIYGLSPQLYSLAFAMNGLGLIAASQVNARIVERVGPTRLLRRALGCVVASALTLLVVVSVGGLTVWAVLVPMFVIVSSLAFVLPNATALALADHAAVAGTASALLGVIQFLVGAIAAPLVGVAGPDTRGADGHRHGRARARGAGRPARGGPAPAVAVRPMTLVTVSASYGAGGSRVAPGARRAARRPVPRPSACARPRRRRRGGARVRRVGRLAAPAACCRASPRSRVAWGRRPAWSSTSCCPTRRCGPEIEQEIHDLAAGGAGVILGRGAAVILHDDERALHVLLDGPKEARVRQAMEIEGIDREAAERRLHRVDRFRRAYIETLYGVDPHEPGICHLVLDSTAIALDDCVELIVRAAAARAAK